MAEMITVDDVDSGAYRALEGFLFLPLVLLVLVGIGVTAGAGVLDTAGEDAMFLAVGGTYVLFLLLAIVSIVVIPALLYVDASRIRAADVEWNPRPILYVIGGILLSYLTLLHYVWKRHEYVVDREDSERWWKLLAVGAFVPPALALALIGPLASTSDPFLIAVPAGLGAILAGPFPIAAYKDATYVRLRSSGWQPNPGNYATIGIFLWVFSPVVYPLTGVYYLFKRRRALGVP